MIELGAQSEVRQAANVLKPRKLFSNLVDIVSGTHGEVVNISQASFARKVRRDRRRDSGIPVKDPVGWAEFKKMLLTLSMQFYLLQSADQILIA